MINTRCTAHSSCQPLLHQQRQKERNISPTKLISKDSSVVRAPPYHIGVWLKRLGCCQHRQTSLPFLEVSLWKPTPPTSLLRLCRWRSECCLIAIASEDHGFCVSCMLLPPSWGCSFYFIFCFVISSSLLIYARHTAIDGSSKKNSKDRSLLVGYQKLQAPCIFVFYKTVSSRLKRDVAYYKWQLYLQHNSIHIGIRLYYW